VKETIKVTQMMPPTIIDQIYDPLHRVLDLKLKMKDKGNVEEVQIIPRNIQHHR